tara:strand:+ start:3999 stop:4409 length:411 start_codon:yes stop_codon:yes gene_type:complete
VGLEKIFKNLIQLEFFVLIITIAYMFFIVEDNQLDTLKKEEVVAWTTDMTVAMWSLLYVVVYGINLYFLYKFKPIGKSLYIPLITIGIILGTISPLSNVTKFDYYFITFGSGILSGLVIALLYFTDIKDKFKESIS